LRTEQTAFAISDIIRGVVTHTASSLVKVQDQSGCRFYFDLIWKGIAAQ